MIKLGTAARLLKTTKPAPGKLKELSKLKTADQHIVSNIVESESRLLQEAEDEEALFRK